MNRISFLSGNRSGYHLHARFQTVGKQVGKDSRVKRLFQTHTNGTKTQHRKQIKTIPETCRRSKLIILTLQNIYIS